jgi:TetR/AcrR family transcriptional regulator
MKNHREDRMRQSAQPIGRRERNKRDKLERIIAAARELFEAKGVDAVTTQQIADQADIGTGTLFLYAKSKSELLLMVQNSSYVTALQKGVADAENTSDTVEAMLAIIRPVVECNRSNVENGRTYLREIVFGDPEEPHHREALGMTMKTEAAVAKVLARDERIDAGDAAVLAQIISAIMFVSMAATINAAHSIDEVLAEIADRVRVMLRR